MSQVKRNFQKSDEVYVVDYWGTSKGAAAFSVRALIIDVDEEKQTFCALLYGDTAQVYSFADYGRLIFDTSIEANKAASKLPTPGDIVYQRIGNRVYKKQVASIGGGYVDNVYDLKICFKRGKSVSTKKMGITVFLNEASARNK